MLHLSSTPVRERAMQSVSVEDARDQKKSIIEEYVSNTDLEHEPMALEDGVVSPLEQFPGSTRPSDPGKLENPLTDKGSYVSKVAQGQHGMFGSGLEMDPDDDDIELLPKDIVIVMEPVDSEFRSAKDAKGTDLYGP
ncbi:hypothetical protein V6N13_065132 [Hibiscus sabdariffa]